MLGNTLITYPAKTTEQLRLPLTKKMCDMLGIEYKEQTKKEKKERALMKRQVTAQIMLGVLNLWKGTVKSWTGPAHCSPHSAIDVGRNVPEMTGTEKGGG